MIKCSKCGNNLLPSEEKEYNDRIIANASKKIFVLPDVYCYPCKK